MQKGQGGLLRTREEVIPPVFKSLPHLQRVDSYGFSSAILSALTECPCSGYDLTKQFDGSLGFFWKASSPAEEWLEPKRDFAYTQIFHKSYNPIRQNPCDIFI